MPRTRQILRFGAVFIPVYALLLAPWPGWHRAYGQGFRAVCSAVLGRRDSASAVVFRAAPANSAFDTEIILANAASQPGTAHRLTKILSIDSRGVGWVPTALLAALVAASPVAGRRRSLALGIGLTAVQAYVVATVGSFVWSQSLRNHSTLMGHLAAGLEVTLVTQMGASFVIPTLIWILVTFRSADLSPAKAEDPIPAAAPKTPA